MTTWLKSSLLRLGRRVLKSQDPASGLQTSAVKHAVIPVKPPQCLSTATTPSVCGYSLTQTRAYIKPPRQFVAPSPYKNPGPARFGYRQEIYDGGPLPKLDTPLEHKPKMKAKDNWSKKRALFGQNDYIDILGDGTLHPAELINAPRYLKAFNGNELQRLVRLMKFEGWKIKHLYPYRYHQIYKRIRFLNKKYNHHRLAGRIK